MGPNFLPVSLHLLVWVISSVSTSKPSRWTILKTKLQTIMKDPHEPKGLFWCTSLWNISACLNPETRTHLLFNDLFAGRDFYTEKMVIEGNHLQFTQFNLVCDFYTGWWFTLSNWIIALQKPTCFTLKKRIHLPRPRKENDENCY